MDRVDGESRRFLVVREPVNAFDTLYLCIIATGDFPNFDLARVSDSIFVVEASTMTYFLF